MVNYLTASRTGVHVRETSCGFEVWNGDKCSPAAYPTYKAAAYHATYLVYMQGLDPADILHRHTAAIAAAGGGGTQ